MIYADMHCDTVTACCDSGGNMTDFCGQVNVEKLKRSGCGAQCFAIFTEGKNASADFERYAEFYIKFVSSCKDVLPVRCGDDLKAARAEGKIGAVLTVENLGFCNGDEECVSALKRAGVRMASLVWNAANAFALPNLVSEGGAPDFEKRERGGLTEAGRRAVELLNRERIMVDVSHLSDGGTEEIIALSSAPVVASHSCCAEVCNVSRNLTDGQIKKLAAKGGIGGLNFCRDFIGRGDPFEALYRHFIHMVDVGGEDFPALGGDFDGIPPYKELADCTFVPRLLEYFSSRGTSARILEKLAYRNFERVFCEVAG